MTAASGVTATQVDAAVLAHVQEQIAAGADTVDMSGPKLAKIMGLEYSRDQLAYHRDRSNPVAALAGQGKRALDRLAAEGVLIRQGAQDTAPTGRRPWQGVVQYWTPAGFARAQADTDAKAQAAEAEARRWALVNTALTAHGVGHANPVGKPPSLNLATWEWLVAKLAPHCPGHQPLDFAVDPRRHRDGTPCGHREETG